MRIISGTNRGMKLFSPSNDKIRPTADMVKEAAFNIIQFSVENSRFLDMFSGTGQMGIEALSRGAQKAWFFDSSPEAVKLIKQNISKAGFENRAEVFCASYESLLTKVPKPVFDLVYIDPPFADGVFAKALDFLTGNGLLIDGATVIVESPKDTPLPERSGSFTIKRRNYGRISLSVYRNEEEK